MCEGAGPFADLGSGVADARVADNGTTDQSDDESPQEAPDGTSPADEQLAPPAHQGEGGGASPGDG